MSESIDSSIFVLIGLFLIGTIYLMFKLTVGSCYKPPPPLSKFHRQCDNKEM
ncbi:hypothetical protein I4U23_021032 [Adineta vaga]|nr:hypothetical protein I4U23_021032 [Adineta vaga]